MDHWIHIGIIIIKRLDPKNSTMPTEYVFYSRNAPINSPEELWIERRTFALHMWIELQHSYVNPVSELVMLQVIYHTLSRKHFGQIFYFNSESLAIV